MDALSELERYVVHGLDGDAGRIDGARTLRSGHATRPGLTSADEGARR
jgi:hypothetical protein